MTALTASRPFTFWSTLRLLIHLPTLLRLLFGLLRDQRVSVLPKVLFGAALLFIVSPLDIPNYVPVLGQMSDLALAILACQAFVNACPPELVEAYRAPRNRSR
jgi:uncharacterized membrane protein YkvA (DUF1232 family)